uniref:Putative secreted protein n=1 Tax=Anopheles marajoara TaxID=58244 RepID=A0A2M4CAJ6_9DIPT
MAGFVSGSCSVVVGTIGSVEAQGFCGTFVANCSCALAQLNCLRELPTNAERLHSVKIAKPRIMSVPGTYPRQGVAQHFGICRFNTQP